MPEKPQDAQLDLGIKKELDKIDVKEFQSLETQCKAEYRIAWQHQKPKKAEALLRLKLYNNQRRDKKKVGDTTMFTIHQTIIASLYQDRLNVTWGAREEGDEETAENLNAMAKFDYAEMGKDELDYWWIWDAAFYGRSFMSLNEFTRDPDKGIFVPKPQVIDPITFLRDPRATSINGDMMKAGSARFYGRVMLMTRDQMENHPHIFKDLDFSNVKYGDNSYSLVQDAQAARDDAQGLQYRRHSDEKNLNENAQYEITDWSTHWKVNGKVKKVRVWLANNRSKVIGFTEYKHDYWPIIDRALYPSSHDWDGTSIPDLTEDKQRARAALQNLGLEAMKASIYPMYIYNSNLVTNRNDLNFKFNKFIPVKGEVQNAITPLNKAVPDMQLLDFIYSTLDISAQKATATPEIQQGQLSSVDRTLGEINLVASKVDTRYSLSAKIFGWSEKRFWRQWYQLYKDNFAEGIDEKVLRLVGAFGAKWRPLKRKQIIAKIDPDVEIQSEVLARAEAAEKRDSFIAHMEIALAEPTTNRRYALRTLGRLSGMQKDELDRLYPPTIDERLAEDENALLSDNKFVPVLADDDNNVHLVIHTKAGDTNQTHAHIEIHKEALKLKKTDPDLFPQDEEDRQREAQQGGPQEPELPGAPAGPAGPATPPAPPTPIGAGNA